MRHRFRSASALGPFLPLTADEREALDRAGDRLSLGITPHVLSLIDPDDPADPIRRTMVPQTAELATAPWERDDPLGEEGHSPLPGLVHTYPDKALFLVTDFCAVYCRYCTRARLVGDGGMGADRRRWEACLDYIRARPAIRDVLLSGGDPLTLSDERLDWLLKALRAIPHVDLIRIGTKIPLVLPQRITPALVRVLRRAHPLWFSVHATHPRELVPEAARALARLADGGIPMCGQTVLLQGVNDDPEVMKALMLGLIRNRVKPYYLHQCDLITGSAHFKTPVEAGLRILEALHGHTTGYAVPHFMIDAPGGGGKIPLSPEYVVGRDRDDLLLRNYRGETTRYPDPLPVAERGRARPAIETSR